MVIRFLLWVLATLPVPRFIAFYIIRKIIKQKGKHLTEELNLIQPNTFVTVNTDDFAEQGVPIGTVMYTVAPKPLPIDEEDLYLQRVFFFVNPTVEYSVDTTVTYLMDPRQLNILDEETSKIYFNQLEIDYGNATTDRR